MIQAMTQAHWITVAVGAVAGVLVVYLLIRMARGRAEPLNQPFDTNGEADLMSMSDEVRKVAKTSYADVKDTF